MKKKHVHLDFYKNTNVSMDTHLITMAFMHAVLEAVHAHDARGIYCTISAKIKADLVEKSSGADGQPRRLLYKTLQHSPNFITSMYHTQL